MDTSSLDGAGGSYLDNSIERRCLEWEASEYYNNAESCPCLDDPDAEGQVRRTEPSTRSDANSNGPSAKKGRVNSAEATMFTCRDRLMEMYPGMTARFGVGKCGGKR